MADLPTGTVTLLFTDIEGSTKLLAELGDRYADVLAEHRRVLREVLQGHGGVEVDTQGDAFFYAFSKANDAVEAARKAQLALADGPVRVRMGLHTGEPTVTEEGYVGADVHRAARITGAGHGGQVLVSETTRELLDPAVELRDLGEHRLKDIEGPVWLFQLGADAFPPLKTISNTNLPRPASSFVGRGRELEEVLAQLREESVRLLTLTGPGGSGKTRLAIEAAAELVPDFKSGVFWVGLATLRDPALVPDSIAQALGAKDGLVEHIADREMLLLLDNLEQVVDAAPALASLLEACPNLKLLVTSRELLRVRGEVEYAVPPLTDAEAVALFCERSRLDPDATIAELCRRLDNLPLAVELAAARTSVLTPEQILERLSQRLDLLKGGRDAETRQRTLRATIEWSYELLSDEEQQLFRRLSVFAGGCTLEAAKQVAEADLDTLQSLVEKSLVRFTDGRYWLLETIREYASERLNATTEVDARHARLADWALRLAEEAELGLRGASAGAWVVRLETELANVRAALDWSTSSNTVLMLRILSALWWFWPRRGRTSEPLRRLELAWSDATPPDVRLRVLRAEAAMAEAASDVPRILRASQERLRLARETGNRPHEFGALHMLAVAAQLAGNLDRAKQAFEEILDLVPNRRSDEVYRPWMAIGALGVIARDQGDLDEAQKLLEECLEISETHSDNWDVVWALQNLGWVAARKRAYADASEHLRRAFDLAHSIGRLDSLAVLLGACTEVALGRGRAIEAAALAGATEAQKSSLGATDFVAPEHWNRVLESLSDSLEQDQFETQYERGRTLEVEASVRLAMACLD